MAEGIQPPKYGNYGGGIRGIILGISTSTLKILKTNKDDTLKGDLASVDIATKTNLNNLVEVGKKLPKKPVSRINLATGLNQPIENGPSNEEELKRFAKLLSDERKLRLA